MMHRFIDELKNIDDFIFVDRIVASHETDIMVENCWEYKDFYMRCAKTINGNHVELRFSNVKNTDKTHLTSGNIIVEVSLPKVVCASNVGAVNAKDQKIICKSINRILREVGSKNVSFENFKIKKIEFSISSFLKESDVVEECDRLFRKSYRPKHKPGKRYIISRNKAIERDGDFETSFYHGSASDNILLYNKSRKETLRKNQYIQPVLDSLPDVLRFEIKCNKNAKDTNFKEWTVKDLFQSGNLLVSNAFRNHFIGYDFVPKDEYIRLVEAHLKKLRQEKHLHRDCKYLKHSDKTLINFLMQVNENGAEAAYRENGALYCRCLEPTRDVGIDILYTKLDKCFNYFENVIAAFDCGTYSVIKVSEYGKSPPLRIYTNYFQRGEITGKKKSFTNKKSTTIYCTHRKKYNIQYSKKPFYHMRN